MYCISYVYVDVFVFLAAFERDSVCGIGECVRVRLGVSVCVSVDVCMFVCTRGCFVLVFFFLVNFKLVLWS